MHVPDDVLAGDQRARAREEADVDAHWRDWRSRLTLKCARSVLDVQESLGMAPEEAVNEIRKLIERHDREIGEGP